MQDSHGQPGVRACIFWLSAHASSTGQCCLSTDLISGLLTIFHPEFSWQWLMSGYQFWVFRENMQRLNQIWFFPHSCLDHLHDESYAWDPQRGDSWWGDCVCEVSILFASSLLPVHMLGAVCDTGGSLKQSVPWGHFGGKLSPLGSAARSARATQDQIRAGLGGSGWSATWLVCLQVVLLCEFCTAWWRCASQGAPVEKSKSGPQALWNIFFVA